MIKIFRWVMDTYNLKNLVKILFLGTVKNILKENILKLENEKLKII